jgi:glutaminyl-peptide cyclotransferase
MNYSGRSGTNGVLRKTRVPVLLVSLLVALSACDDGPDEIGYEIAATFPHDPGAYTQGLLFHDGFLFESTGRWGASSVRKVNAQSGEVVASTAVDSAYFAEGLALVGSELIQLTWKAGIAFVYDVETLEVQRQFQYSGEGWGLCYDGSTLFMSDGSSRIVRRDPASFEVLSQMEVTADGFGQSNLNELECVGDFIYANIYLSDRIVRIDKLTGEIVGELDGYALSLASRRPPEAEAVLNGIAYIQETGFLLVTGKLWPTLFAIRLDED